MKMIAAGSRMALGVFLLTAIACQKEWVPPNTSEQIPLREVTRTGQPVNAVFDRASLIVLATVKQRLEIEKLGWEGQSLSPPDFFGAVTIRRYSVVRLNERKKDDPDLSQGSVMVEQFDRGQQPIRFEFGTYYLLLLNPSATMHKREQPSTHPTNWYTFAVPQGGFEVRGGRLVPLTVGGELDAYNGRLADDVIKEITAVK